MPPRDANPTPSFGGFGLSGTLDVGNPIFNAPGLGIAIDTPVFEAFYNPLTDVFGCDPNETSTPFATPHKPNGLWVVS